MNESKNKKIILFSILAILLTSFIGFTGIVMVADVQAIGPNGSKVGLATMNDAVYQLVSIKYGKTWDIISDILLYICIIGVFAVIGFGFYQWGKKRSLLKVDKEIFIYGLSFIVVISFWIIFDKAVIVNYRPVLEDNELAPSYPSTHVMVVTFISGATVLLSNKYIKLKHVEISTIAIAAIFVLITMLGRILSGQHWITDVIGGFLLGVTLLMVYVCGVSLFQCPDNRRK